MGVGFSPFSLLALLLSPVVCLSSVLVSFSGLSPFLSLVLLFFFFFISIVCAVCVRVCVCLEFVVYCVLRSERLFFQSDAIAH